MSKKSLEKSVAQDARQNASESVLQVSSTNPILSNARFNMSNNLKSDKIKSKHPEIQGNEGWFQECRQAVENRYQESTDQAKDIINSMITALATCSSEESKSQFSITLEPFPIMIKGQIQEVYDFEAKNISICPIAFQKRTQIISPKPGPT